MMLKIMDFKQINFKKLSVVCLPILLAGCIPPPKSDTVSKHSAPITEPNTPTSKAVTGKSPAIKPAPITRAEEKSLKKNQRPQGLPTGWAMVDPKGIISRVEQETKSNSVVLFVASDSGLEVIGARDLNKQEHYRGKLDGGHLIALSPKSEKILVLFSSRQNAKISVLLTAE